MDWKELSNNLAERIERHRFLDDGIRPPINRLFYFAVCAGGEKNHRCRVMLRFLPQKPDQLGTIDLRHIKVGKHQVRLLSSGEIETLLPVAGADRLKAFGFKQERKHFADRWLIFNNKNFVSHSYTFFLGREISNLSPLALALTFVVTTLPGKANKTKNSRAPSSRPGLSCR
jgi:hypothetical protein